MTAPVAYGPGLAALKGDDMSRNFEELCRMNKIDPESVSIDKAIALLAECRRKNGYATMDELLAAEGIDRGDLARWECFAAKLAGHRDVAIRPAMGSEPAGYRLRV